MKNKIFKVISIVLSVAIVLSVCAMSFTTAFAESVTYFVSYNGDDNNTGIDADHAFKTIEGAILYAKAQNAYDADDVVDLKVVSNASNDALWGTAGEDNWVRFPEHDFTVQVSSTGNITDIGNQNVVFGGPMIFENVHFKTGENVAKTIVFNGNKIELRDGVNINAYYRIVAGDISTTTKFEDDINIDLTNVANSEFKLYLSNLKNDRTFGGDINVIFDSSASRSDVYLGTIDGGNTTYEGNVNLNVKASSTDFTIKRANANRGISFAEGKALQVINSSGNKTVYGSNMSDNVVASAGNYFFITNESGFKNALKFTDTAGKFAVDTLTYTVSAQLTNADGVALDEEPITAQNGFLTLSTAGYYTVTMEQVPRDFLFYVSADGDDNNSGLDADNALKTIEAAINKVIEAGYNTKDQKVEVYVKYGEGTSVPFGDSTTTVTLPTHKFTLNIMTDPDDTTKANICNQNVIFGGPTTFKNVHFSGTSAKTVYLNGYKVDFGKDVTTSNYYRFAVGDVDSTTEFTDDINVTFKDVGSISNFCLGNEKSNRVFSGDINVEYDTEKADGTLYLGIAQNYGNYTTTYNGNVNLNIKSTKSKFVLTRRAKTSAFKFADDSAIQIINSSGKPIEYGSNIDEQAFVDAGKFIFITNNTTEKDILSFTDTAGKFKVNSDKYAIKATKYGVEYFSEDGYLTLEESGPYELKLICIEHSYDYDCDRICNECLEKRNANCKFVSYTANGDATCQKNETETAYCEFGCGETDTRDIPDSYADHKYTTYTPNGDATCQKNCTETASCDFGCGTEDTRDIPNSKVSHKYTTYTPNGDATCQKNETETASCDFGCGEQDTRDIPNSKVDHKFTDATDTTCDFECGYTRVLGKMLVTEGEEKYYYNNGVKQVEVTDLVWIDGVWYYIEEGRWASDIDTLHKINGKWFLVKGGIWNKTTGLEEYKGKTFYVVGGKWNSSVTDLKKVDGVWYYIQYGKWNNTIDTLHKINGKWFLIKNGIWNKTTGLVEYKDKTFYVVGGKWNSSVNTLYKKGSKFYAIKSGKLYEGKTIITYSGKKFYCNKGYAQLSFSGKVKIGTKTYTVKKGIVQ